MMNELDDGLVEKLLDELVRLMGDLFVPYFLLQLLISCLSFATFAVGPDKPQNRLVLTLTLILTVVTFKFVINQSLPRISYLTYLVSAF